MQLEVVVDEIPRLPSLGIWDPHAFEICIFAWNLNMP